MKGSKERKRKGQKGESGRGAEIRVYRLEVFVFLRRMLKDCKKTLSSHKKQAEQMW